PGTSAQDRAAVPGAAALHARMQLLAPGGEAAADRVLAGATRRRAPKRLAVAAEIGIGHAHVAEVAQQELDQDQVVEKADRGNVVGDDVFRIAEVNERR